MKPLTSCGLEPYVDTISELSINLHMLDYIGELLRAKMFKKFTLEHQRGQLQGNRDDHWDASENQLPFEAV